ncbi:hypothetical protein [Pseudoxanthomonas sp. UTMC 1351]|uniref:DUF6932 family protein n=1 Tax=Pseudoxanthomonas sp. UTMC 1351 TaxID=2695853 RepID=UPI0034CFE3CE
MIPTFQSSGLLPPGIHPATWHEIEQRFGYNLHRKWLLQALMRALRELRAAGCSIAYLDGSFVTAKELPEDYDACWSITNVDPSHLDQVLLKFDDGRRAMKAKYFGDLFPAEITEDGSGKPFLDFFQIDKSSGDSKGIISIDLRGLP